MIKIRQECRAIDSFQEIGIPSKSDPKKVHVVLVHPKLKERSVCDCEGYKFRTHCSHIDLAFENRCHWNEETGIRQLPWQRMNKACPVCGGDTIMVMIDE